MSEVIKTDDCGTDTQDTFFENSENDIISAKQETNISISNVRESQNLQLFIDENEDFSQKIDEKNEQKNVEELTHCTKIQLLEKEIGSETQHENTEVGNNKKQPGEASPLKSLEVVTETEKHIAENENDDDLIQATPPQSPSRKPIPSLKRKADGPIKGKSKLPRTPSDDTINKESEIIEESDILMQETGDVLAALQETTDVNDIIPESQEPLWESQITSDTQPQNTTDIENNISDSLNDIVNAKDNSKQDMEDKQPFEEKLEKTKEQLFVEKNDENLNNAMIFTHVDNCQLEESENDKIKEMVEEKKSENKVLNELDEMSSAKEDIDKEKNKPCDEIEDKEQSSQVENEKDSLKEIISDSIMENFTENIKDICKKDTNQLEKEEKHITMQNKEIVNTILNDENLSNTKLSEKNDKEITKNSLIDESEKVCNENSKEDKTIEENECKSRMSIELIFDGKVLNKEKDEKTEIVEIDGDDDEIILDTSQENKNDTIIHACNTGEVVRGKSSQETIKETMECKLSDITAQSSQNEIHSEDKSKDNSSDIDADIRVLHSKSDPSILEKTVKFDTLTVPVVNISDNEEDMPIEEESKENKSMTDMHLPHNHLASLKTIQIEREICMFVKLKCLLNLDENTREPLQKELVGVQCEFATSHSRHNSYNSALLADDISGTETSNKDTNFSPGSVTSNQQPLPLQPSRLSMMSTTSSSSSASSAASLAAKMLAKDNAQFSLPRVPRPAKNTKKTQEATLIQNAEHDKTTLQQYERLTKEWKNAHLLTTSMLEAVNSELNNFDCSHNGGTDSIEDSSTPRTAIIPTSTPELEQSTTLTSHALQSTPKSTKKGRLINKRPKSNKSSKAVKSNGYQNKVSPDLLVAESDNKALQQNESKPITETRSVTPMRHVKTMTALRNTPNQSEPMNDELIGAQVFAKWSDNIYYPGTVLSKDKLKYKVNFYDGKSKYLIEDFIVPMVGTLKEGLSVYATANDRDYNSPGMIVGISKLDDEEVVYTIELDDEGEEITVPITNISMTADQVQILKEELKPKSLPSTPQHLSHVTLENVVDGKRRSKRIATPSSYNTPKAKRPFPRTSTNANAEGEASVSGLSAKRLKTDENNLQKQSSDSNSAVEESKEIVGVQSEIEGTPNQTLYKGKSTGNKAKGKPSRSRRKVTEKQEAIEILGPIPPEGSTLFKGMIFMITCASTAGIDKYQQHDTTVEDTQNSESSTDNETEWTNVPFVREHLRLQILNNGGQICDNFEDVPKSQYENTKLITNVPNCTAKSLLCLSVGIPAISYKWIIRCCRENKLINISEERLPVGWSLDKRKYIEMYERPDKKPLTHVIVVIPLVETEKEFAKFWHQVCENAGATVIVADNPETSFIEGTVILTTKNCPLWVMKKSEEWEIPLVSHMWITQCLIEGKIVPHETQPAYIHTFARS